MPLFRRNPPVDVAELARLVAAEVTKAPTSAVATTTDLTPLARAIVQAQQPSGVGQWVGAFGPGMPIQPSAIDPRDPATGQPAPRRSQFPVAVNLNLTDRAVPFRVLRDTADIVDVVRRCIETRKSHLLALEWDITLSKSAQKRVMAAEGITSPGKASQLLRQRFEPDMARLRDWWEKPDRPNGFDFASWFAAAQEEQLVVDALTVYPRRNMKGDTISLELIAGDTIKPLLDNRGAVPVAPLPAYQQILYGFPRGEWTASADADDELSTAQLIYRPRYRRTFTPYGFPEVEQALSATDLWLKTIDWIRTEFDSGTTPDTWMRTDVNIGGPQGLTPDQLREYEQVMNASLAGNDAERHALHLLPKGFEPQEMRAFAEKFSASLYEMLIKLVCMVFAVMPTEIGFTPSHGLGGKGHQEGEENSAYRKDIHPSKTWWENLFTDLSRMYLGMPQELQFSFLGYEVEDRGEVETVADSRTRGGRSTINEERAERGEPLFDVPEADTPFIQTSAGLIWLDGRMATTPVATEPGAPGQPTGEAPGATEPDGGGDAPPEGDSGGETGPQEAETTTEDEVPEGHVRVASHIRRVGGQPAVDEAAKFVTFARKRIGKAWRPFAFEHVPPALADELNDLGAGEDLERIKAVVASLGKAGARRSPGKVTAATKTKLIDRHKVTIAAATKAMLPAGSELVDEWATREAATKAPAATTDQQRRARTFIREQLGEQLGEQDALDGAVDDLLDDGYAEGLDALDVDADEVDDQDSRKPGLLAQHPVIVAGIVATVVATVADHVVSGDADAVDGSFDPNGWPADTAAVELTAALTVGVQDGCVVRGINLVRLVAGGDECDFCQEYDGRIMDFDHDSGMPPLHHGCQCDIEPLEESP